jgi:hypothetical protein
MLLDPLIPEAPRQLSPTAETLINFITTEPLGSLVVAIDPGDVHCGIVIGGFFPPSNFKEPMVFKAGELTPGETLHMAQVCFPKLRAVVLETFSLRDDKAKVQTGSSMATSRLIGALEYIAFVSAEGTIYTPGEPIRPLRHFLYEQSPSIKTGAVAQLRARGTTSYAKSHGLGGHVLDAELHFYYFMYERIAITERQERRTPTAKHSEFDSDLKGPTPPKPRRIRR